MSGWKLRVERKKDGERLGEVRDIERKKLNHIIAEALRGNYDSPELPKECRFVVEFEEPAMPGAKA